MQVKLVPHAVALLVLSLSGCGPSVGASADGSGATDAAASEPGYVRAAVPDRPLPPLPADAPGEWRLAFLDVETTGLVPGHHELVDVGVVLTDLDGNILDSLLVRVQPDHPERTSPQAASINGFTPEKWRAHGALSPEQAIDSLVALHRRVAGESPTLMVAHNSQFDAAFLDHLFRNGQRSWREIYHYYVLDIPSMAWMLGLRELDGRRLAQRLGVEELADGPDLHTGLRCAIGNVRMYRALLAEAERQRDR